MTIKEYQEESWTAIYPNKGRNLEFTSLKLANSAGKVANLTAEMIRVDDNKVTSIRKKNYLKELENVLFYLTLCASELGTSVEELMNEYNAGPKRRDT